jgi:hypothetical protein
MRHLEPLRAQPVPNGNRQGPGSALAWIVAATVLTLGCGAAAGWVFGDNAPERIAKSEIEARQLAFTRIEPLPLQLVAERDVAAAVRSMQLEPARQAALLKMALPPALQGSAAAPSGVRLVQVTVWDTHSEDGDVVALVSAGYRREVVLSNAPQTIALPIDGAAQMQVVGVRDGGGGITLGVQGAERRVLMPIMSEGQTLTLPLSR